MDQNRQEQPGADMNRDDSDSVLQLKQELEAIYKSRDARTAWGRAQIRKIQSAIRSQRLAEARTLGTHTPDEWDSIVREFNYRCVRCGCFPAGGPCKDHITPIYLGGSDAASNLQPLCRQCNTGKGPDSFNWAEFRREHGFDDEVEP